MSKKGVKQANTNRFKAGILFIKKFWRALDKSYRRSIIYALTLHAAVLILLGSGWSSKADVKPIVAPRHINAVVINASEIDALKKKENEQKKKVDKKKIADDKKRKQLAKKKAQEKKKKAEQKKKRDAEKKKALAKKKAIEKKKKEDSKKKALLKKKQEQKKKEQKKLEEKKRKEAEAKRLKEQKIKEQKRREEKERKQQEDQLQQMMEKAELQRQHEQEARLRAQQEEADRRLQEQLKADQIAEMNEVDRFIALIRAKITRNWHKPPGAKLGATVVLQLHLFPTGELSRAEILKSSGSPAFDRSALSEAKSISKYPVPSDNRIFERNFRRFSMSFSHQED